MGKAKGVSKRLQGKVAVITGGSKGIGKAIAMALAREGCDIVIASRREADLKLAEKELSSLGANVLAVKTDVRRVPDVENLAKKVERRFGGAQILVNNAGVGYFEEVLRMKEEDFRATLETNLFGTFYCTKAFLPYMLERKEGHVVNIASLAGKNSFARGSAYCASKHALIAFAECLMLEVRHHNVKVTTICPGTVQTDFGDHNSKNKPWALTAEDVSKTVLDVLTSSSGSIVSQVDLRPLRPSQKQ
jgi:NAD(P)-dependent dehydrogenase (short-subunit alcohol dehydrogenase family)